jgi:site-specific DNA-methyltransferase (adenine-specific)
VTPYLKTERATLYHARAEEVYPHLAPGSVSMIWSDGPYAMKKAPWDMMGIDGLADWYAPHVEAWGRVCAPSATVYLWGTDEGWARLDPVMRAHGWTFRVKVTWLKTNPPAQKGQNALTCWADFTEVCGVYQQEPNEVDLWNTYGAEHPVRVYLDDARKRSGLTLGEVDAALGTSDMARHWFTWSQWCLPSAERYAALQDLLPSLTRPLEDLARERDRVWTAFREEWDRVRACFTAPTGEISNVWKAPMVAPTHRLKTADGDTHECEKPLAFADRVVRASTRIGDTILDPFAGTNRIAVACRRLPEEERRHAIGIEMDQRWLDAVRPSLIADHAHTGHSRQSTLFTRHT